MANRTPNRTPTTPQTAAACMVLYRMADLASTAKVRALLLRAVMHLTGQGFATVVRTWKDTR